MKDREPKAMKARLDEIRKAVWTPNSTLPMIRKRVALILQKLTTTSDCRRRCALRNAAAI